MKFKLSKVKWFAVLVSLLSSVMSFSVGFGLWSIQAVDTQEKQGNIQVDDFNDTPTEVSCFTKPSLTGFAFSQYGFLQSDNTFASSGGVISGTAQFKASTAKSVVYSLNTNSRFKLKISLSGYASSATTTIGTEINVTAMSITSGLTVDSNGTITNSEDNLSIYREFNVSNIDTTSNSINFAFSMTISYIGSSFETFYTTYSATGAGFKVSLLAEEYE